MLIFIVSLFLLYFHLDVTSLISPGEKEITFLANLKETKTKTFLESPKPISEKSEGGLLELKPFSPNQISRAELIGMGIDSQLADRWVNFREALGKYENEEQLFKLYGLDDKLKAELKDVIMWGNNHLKPKRADIAYQKPKMAELRNSPICLNEADSQELEGLKGIGRVRAARIVKYRELLGGFAQLGQLLEVYGLDSSILKLNGRWLKITSPPYRCVDWNSLNYRALAMHPYIDWHLAKAIVRYRNQHDSFSCYSDLLKIFVMDSLTWQKLRPYSCLADSCNN